MEMSLLTEDFKNLKKDGHRIIYEAKAGSKIAVTHTAKLSPKDFAVSLLIPGQEEFRPTHIRLIIDLYIKRESNREDAHKLFLALERINAGEDPEVVKEDVVDLKFPMQFDDPDVNLYYTQLLMIEQDINYGPDSGKQSKLNPPHEFLMRFIRWVASGDAQIDRIIFGAVRRFPAPDKYGERIR